MPTPGKDRNWRQKSAAGQIYSELSAILRAGDCPKWEHYYRSKAAMNKKRRDRLACTRILSKMARQFFVRSI
jgi:hypothetical protein